MPHTINDEKGVIDKQIYQRSSTTKLVLENLYSNQKKRKNGKHYLKAFQTNLSLLI